MPGIYFGEVLKSLVALKHSFRIKFFTRFSFSTRYNKHLTTIVLNLSSIIYAFYLINCLNFSNGFLWRLSLEIYFKLNFYFHSVCAKVYRTEIL